AAPRRMRRRHRLRHRGAYAGLQRRRGQRLCEQRVERLELLVVREGVTYLQFTHRRRSVVARRPSVLPSPEPAGSWRPPPPDPTGAPPRAATTRRGSRAATPVVTAAAAWAGKRATQRPARRRRRGPVRPRPARAAGAAGRASVRAVAG